MIQKLVKITCVEPLDDINEETGETVVWIFHSGSRPNASYRCKCIWKVLDSKCLFRLMTGKDVLIEERVLNMFFKLI